MAPNPDQSLLQPYLSSQLIRINCGLNSNQSSWYEWIIISNPIQLKLQNRFNHGFDSDKSRIQSRSIKLPDPNQSWLQSGSIMAPNPDQSLLQPYLSSQQIQINCGLNSNQSSWYEWIIISNPIQLKLQNRFNHGFDSDKSRLQSRSIKLPDPNQSWLRTESIMASISINQNFNPDQTWLQIRINHGLIPDQSKFQSRLNKTPNSNQ